MRYMSPLFSDRWRTYGYAFILLGMFGAGIVTVSGAMADPIGNVDNDVIKGDTVVGVQGVSRDGRVVLLDGDGEEQWSYGQGDGATYHAVAKKDDHLYRVAFANISYNCKEFESPCGKTGYRMLETDPEPHVTSSLTYETEHPQETEVHDVEELPSGEIVITDMTEERIFTVDENGEETWEWRGSNLYEQPGNYLDRDWLHINDVDYLGNNLFLISVRNANQLVIVERGGGVVEVINEDRRDDNDQNCMKNGWLEDVDGDGSVRCGDPDKFREQHNPHMLSPNAVVVADSENDRVVELHKQDGEWEVVWEVTQANGYFFNWPRDADRLPNGNTLIADTRNHRVVEVTKEGETVWSAYVPALPYEADRLPGHGEEFAGNPYTNIDQEEHGERMRVPGVWVAMTTIGHVIPLPHWMTQWQFVVAVISIYALLFGGVLVTRIHPAGALLTVFLISAAVGAVTYVYVTSGGSTVQWLMNEYIA